MQRPMPSPEKAIGAVRAAAAAAAAVLALERNSAERNPSKRDRGGGVGFDYRPEDEDAVGMACCRGRKKKTNKRTGCLIKV